VSQDLSLYLLEANLPTPRQWAKAIREQGFKFKLDTDFDIRDSAGFIPCGDEAGFELLSDAMTQQEHDELCFAEPPMDWCVTLCAQSDDDFLLALAALASLASIAGGRVIDMQTGEIFTAEEALARARARFAANASVRRGPEPLDKAIRQILVPVLAEHGFKLLKKRWYYRVRNRIAQYFYLEKCRRDPSGFYSRGGAELLMPHRDFLSYGRQVYFEPPGERSWLPWPGTDDAQAFDSIRQVVEQFRTGGMAFFERMAQPLAFVDEYKDLPLDIPYTHEFSRVGCSLLCAGDVEVGRAYIERAVAAFQQDGAKFRADGTPDKDNWPERYAAELATLLPAIENGTHLDLLERWYRESLATLKLTED